jgi:hypothetical protein
MTHCVPNERDVRVAGADGSSGNGHATNGAATPAAPAQA